MIWASLANCYIWFEFVKSIQSLFFCNEFSDALIARYDIKRILARIHNCIYVFLIHIVFKTTHLQ